MTLVTFMRHGVTDWNAQGRFMSTTDFSLSKDGRQSLSRSFDLIRSLHPQLVVSSPAQRCIETAEAILPETGLTEYTVWDDLREIDFGLFEGKTAGELKDAGLSEAFSSWLDPTGPSEGAPHGEAWEAIDRRVVQVLKRLEGLQSDVLVVGHGYFSRAVIVRALTGLPSQNLRCLELANGSMSSLSSHRGFWRLEFHNSQSPYMHR